MNQIEFNQIKLNQWCIHQECKAKRPIGTWVEHKMWVEPKPKTAGIEGIKGTVKDEAKKSKKYSKILSQLLTKQM